MAFQIDISADKRTNEQNAQLERYYQAAKVLRAAGFKAKVSLLFVSKPTQSPALIELE
jgi:hypothetical protein